MANTGNMTAKKITISARIVNTIAKTSLLLASNMFAIEGATDRLPWIKKVDQHRKRELK